MLLTGASVGIGEELAYHYARLGSHLVLTAHTEALLQKVRHSISSLIGGGGRGTGPGFESLQTFRLPVWPWVSHLISLRLSFLICKSETIKGPSPGL